MKSVLIVDDNELVRNLIVTILEDARVEVLTASTGPEAIELLGRHGDAIGCVLQDLSMPGMPGEEVVAELLQINPDIPVIVLSVDDPGYSSSRLSGLKIADYIQKPFESDVLITRVRDLIQEQGG